jgi:hypothetical protein
MDRYLLRDLEFGISSGRFTAGSALMVRDMILGSVFFGVETLLTEGAAQHKHQHHIEDMLCTILQGIGLPAGEARAIAFMPLPAIGPVCAPVFATLKTAQDN